MTITDVKKMDIYWFSGAGNTLRAAEIFADRLRLNGWTIRLLPIEKRSAELFDPHAVFCLAFPTHCFSIPLVIRAFLRRIPVVDKTPAVYLGTHGLFSGGVRGHLKGILKRKGFHCIAGRIFRMPDSFFPFCGDRLHQRLIKRTLAKVERYADRIDAGKRGWFRIPLLSSFAEMFCFGFFASRKLSVSTRTTVHPARTKKLSQNHTSDNNAGNNVNENATKENITNKNATNKNVTNENVTNENADGNTAENIHVKACPGIDENVSVRIDDIDSENVSSDDNLNQCRSCRLCLRFCPVGAISLDENEQPKISGEKCQNCLRCVAICPIDKMRHLFFSPYHGEPSEDFKNRLSSVLNQNNR